MCICILCAAPGPKSINPEKKTMSTRQRNVVRRGRRYFFPFFFFLLLQSLGDYFFPPLVRDICSYARAYYMCSACTFIILIHTHTHTYVYLDSYIYIYIIYVCVCVYKCETGGGHYSRTRNKRIPSYKSTSLPFRGRRTAAVRRDVGM